MAAISVIMATHNNEGEIALAIASVLEQSLADLDLVVVNDASTDATPEILEAFAARDSRVIVVHNEHNLGRALSRNRALEQARADLVAVLDADDLALPRRFEHQAAFMRDHPELGILGSWAIAIDPEHQLLGPITRPTTDMEIRRRLQWLLMPFVHSTIVFRRNLLPLTGMYDARFKASEDFHLCYRLVQQSQAASLPEFLTLYRVPAAPTPELVRDRYRWNSKVAWDLFKRYPNGPAFVSLARSVLISLLPGSLSRHSSSIYKDSWDQTLLSEAQVAEVKDWIEKLNRSTKWLPRNSK